jgi:hypothetical protein
VGEDLGADGQGDVFGPVAAEVEPDGSMDPGDISLGYSKASKAIGPVLLGAA